MSKHIYSETPLYGHLLMAPPKTTFTAPNAIYMILRSSRSTNSHSVGSTIHNSHLNIHHSECSQWLSGGQLSGDVAERYLSGVF